MPLFIGPLRHCSTTFSKHCEPLLDAAVWHEMWTTAAPRFEPEPEKFLLLVTQPIKVHWISVTVAKTDDLVFPNYSPKTDKLIFPRPTSKAVFPQPWIRMGEIGAFEKNQSTQKVEFSQSWVTPSSSSSSSTMPVTFPGLWQTNPLSKRRWIRFERIKSCLDISGKFQYFCLKALLTKSII